MAELEGGRITGIRHIVRLKEILQKWHAASLIPKEEPKAISGISPAIDMRIKGTSTTCDSDDDASSSPVAPTDVPKGYLAVYVGPEQRRFVIPMCYLGLPVFKVLLEKAEEEFGFHNSGALTFPCEIETFKYILRCMERHQKGLIDDEGNPTDLQE